MAFSFNFFVPRASQRPQLACEITPEGVIAGRHVDAERSVTAFAPLPAEVVRPGIAEANLADAQRVTQAIRKAVDEVAGREKPLTLVIPDAAVRVLLMDFETLPSKLSEALPIVRFRLKKLAPFEVDDAAVSYQVLPRVHGAANGQLRVLVTVMPSAIRAEYEAVVRAAGYEPGVVLPATLAAVAAAPAQGASLILTRNGHTLTTVITDGDELLLHRSLDLPPGDEGHADELARAVSVSLAYFEDTLHYKPTVLHYAGPGGAQEFRRALGPHLSEVLEEYGLQIEDLLRGPHGALTAIPSGLAAGVMGALAN
ncbi:hypothetical protein [Silvibacterium dinghuense]|uniref:Type IV pilus assembly protein PilM n=1 Tax=Silvibacterium dinghuense TaxID=1560006 RepID=A0A4Q1SB87_9BACT|nr:hypothetical protein [Silvibacterium dinghuense]RXS94404.1 hypothetical protein ESZ00_15110 [Silvibacterium dinghuense]GGH16333.1 hypothetical protein GCM10011586_38090 [Silvibacterium dinghuense]